MHSDHLTHREEEKYFLDFSRIENLTLLNIFFRKLYEDDFYQNKEINQHRTVIQETRDTTQ